LKAETETDFKFDHLDDPAFIEERRAVREELERLPPDHAGRAELERLFAAMETEFDRRATRAWRVS
jgi:hypothetical protein